MAGTRFTFAGEGGLKPTGHLEAPEGSSRLGNFRPLFHLREGQPRRRVHRTRSRAGIGVLRFDFAGTGIASPAEEAVASLLTSTI